MSSHPIDSKQLKEFGIVLGIILAVILGGLNHWRGHAETAWIFIVAGLVVELISFTVPVLLIPSYHFMIKFGHVMGWINTRLILVALFYLIMTPIGLIMRLFGKDLLDQKLEPNSPTYWKDRDKKEFTKDHYEKQF